ncbi:unnamed protein product, partial [Mesorhabditis belari]|uniref:Uncharacterized protein n=1 Tax=Mesorhabditis belari TaxID=2138241 RepID=A0AAF3FDZ6_9BILA
MSGIYDKAKDAVSNAAEAVKDKFKDMTGQSHEDRARDSAQSAWDETKEKAGEAKENAKGWAEEKYEKVEKQFKQ